MDSINTIISFATLVTFPSFSNLNIPATPPNQTILSNPLISTLRLAWILLLLYFVTIYTLATLPTHVNIDTTNILLIPFILSKLPTHATHENIPVLTTHSSVDSINTIISFAAFVTFPSFSNIHILATPPTQTILGIPLISIPRLAWMLLLLYFVTIYTLATLPTHVNIDTTNILLIPFILSGLPTHATHDNIPVLTTHSSVDSINIIISFATLLTITSFSNLNILATPPTQTIVANPLISILRLAWILYTCDSSYSCTY